MLEATCGLRCWQPTLIERPLAGTDQAVILDRLARAAACVREISAQRRRILT